LFLLLVLSHKSLFAAAEECTITVHDQKVFDPANRGADKILTDTECETRSPFNYLIFQIEQTGDANAYFILDMGCVQIATAVRLKNARNPGYDNA